MVVTNIIIIFNLTAITAIIVTYIMSHHKSSTRYFWFTHQLLLTF